MITAIGSPSLWALSVRRKNEKGDEYATVGPWQNVIDKVYHPELKLTVSEARNGQTEAKFYDAGRTQ